MERIIRWFVNNTVAANMLMLFIMVAGVMTLPRMKMEVFPDINLDIVSISVIYPGASPESVEESICLKLEEKLTGLKGVKRISSTASENVGTTLVEILPGEDINEIKDNVQTKIDAIDSFPTDAEKPVVQTISLTTEVVTVAVYGNVEEESLNFFADEVKSEIDALDEVSLTSISGKKDREISIEISKNNLQKYRLTMDQIASAIRANSMDMPGGGIDTDIGEILIRSKGQAYNQEEFESIPIVSRIDGSNLLLGDIATIKDGFADVEVYTKFNDQPAMYISVFRIGDQNSLNVSAAVKDYVKQKSLELPDGINLTLWNDEAELLQARIDLLTENGLLGLALVIIVLALFLKTNLAGWVSLGIPISFLGGFMLMPIVDVSINMLSLFTFILVLGIVVDDAIVVGENIYLWRERGLEPKEAAIKGAYQVSTPVIFAVLTTMVTFSPMLSVAGNVGQIWRIIPLITIVVLIFSLIESLTILPAHLGHLKDRDDKNKKTKNIIIVKWEKLQNFLRRGIQNFVEKKYKPFLKWTIDNRLTTTASSVAILFLTVGIIAGGWMKFVFFPSVDSDLLIANIVYPNGSPVELSQSGLKVLEESLEKLEEEYKSIYPDHDMFLNISATAGGQPVRNKTQQGPGTLSSGQSGSHLAELAIELSPGETRPITATDIAKRFREITPAIIGAKEVNFSSELFSAGEAVNVQLSSNNLNELRGASVFLKEKLASYTGVIDIKDSFSIGKEEIQLSLLPSAKNYGITMAFLASQVRQAFYGLEVQTLSRGKDEVKVFIRYPSDERKTVKSLENLLVRTPQGNEIPIRQIANLDFAQGYSSISRIDRKRAINVTADVDISKTTSNEVVASITQFDLPSLQSIFPQVKYSLEGEQQEQTESLGSIFRNFFFAMIVVYTLLAIPFRSYLQPFVIMSAIPFGLTGAVIGHIVMGLNLTVLSLIGIVALAGVVVNDSLVLVDFINRYRDEGHSTLEAVMEAGPRRFRPILLTSLTTFFGLFPLLLEKSFQAQWLIPMATSLAFGVLFATVITLVMVPSFYLIIEDVRIWFKKT